jgi:hypothetical protein
MERLSMTKPHVIWTSLAVFCVLGCWSSRSQSTTDACWFDDDVVKLTRSITVPTGQRDEFIRYIQTNVPGDMLFYGAVESDRSFTMILQNIDAGILAIEIENEKPTDAFRIIVKTCDFTADWRPYWDHVKRYVDAFQQTARR